MIQPKYCLRYATKKDLDHFYKDEEVLYSSRAWVLARGRRRFAIGGIWLMKTQNTVFIKVKKSVPKKEMWKAAKAVIKNLSDLPIMCFRDEEVPNSKRFLEKLGFKYFGILNNQEIYKL